MRNLLKDSQAENMIFQKVIIFDSSLDPEYVSVTHMYEK